MSISRVVFRDFLIFEGEFEFGFCPGINVLLGGNATGKTTLMKQMYLQLKFPLGTGFPILEKESTLVQQEAGEFRQEGYTFNAVFLPEKEILGESYGFRSILDKYKTDFSLIYDDLLTNVELPETREIRPNAAKLLDKIKEIIGGEVVYRDDRFYIVSDERTTPFSLEANGYRKLGTLWRLLRTGRLEQGTALFWDEPENSLNPELIPKLAEILLELSRGGVQVFVATHSYSLARWFDVMGNADEVMYHNLTKNENGGIECSSHSEYTKLKDVSIDNADEKLFEAVVKYAMGVSRNE